MPGKAVAEAVQGGRISFFPISKRKKMSALETSKGNKEMRQKCVGMMTMPEKNDGTDISIVIKLRIRVEITGNKAYHRIVHQ